MKPRTQNDYNRMTKDIIRNYSGLEHEEIVSIEGWSYELPPLFIATFGITHPDPRYRVVRYPSSSYVIESVVSGVGYIVLDGKQTRLQAGDVCLIKMGQNVEYFADKDDPWEKKFINFHGSLAAELIALYRLNDTVYRIDIDDVFKRVFALESLPHTFENTHTYSCELITTILMRMARTKQQTHEVDEVARKIRDMLFASRRAPFSLDTICDSLLLSKPTVIKRFKDAYGVTPYQWLLSYKIDLAKSLLITTDETVKYIAAHLGFSSPYNFSEVFKKHVGISPQIFRQQRLTQNP